MESKRTLLSQPAGSVKSDQIFIVTTDGKTVFRSSLAAEDISDLLAGSGVGTTGVLDIIDQTDISGDPSQYEVSWDESVYTKILVLISGIQPATDGVSLYGILGSANGGTMYTSTNDYDGVEMIWEGTGTFSASPDSDKLRLLPSCSDAANETISGEIVLNGLKNADVGGTVRSELIYINSASNQRTIEVRGFSDGFNAAIDTFRLFWASGNFANTGSIAVLGFPA